jgi:hypothetical protein
MALCNCSVVDVVITHVMHMGAGQDVLTSCAVVTLRLLSASVHAHSGANPTAMTVESCSAYSVLYLAAPAINTTLQLAAHHQSLLQPCI